MDLEPMIGRLQAGLTGFKTIGSAADLDAIENVRGPVPEPSVFVLPLEEVAADNELIGRVGQVIQQKFAVVLVCSNRSDVRGQRAMSELKSRREQVMGALLGWIADPLLGNPVLFSGGRVLKFEQGLLWWADEFIVDTYREGL